MSKKLGKSTSKKGKEKWKLVKRRKTPERDPVRLAENLWSQYGEGIRDVESFNRKYNDYLEDTPEAIENEKLRANTMEHFKANHPYFGGLVVPTGRRRRVAPLPRVGRRERRLVKQQRQNLSMFRYMAKERTRTVYARKTSFVSQGKTRVVYRDLKGRFARRLK